MDGARFLRKLGKCKSFEDKVELLEEAKELENQDRVAFRQQQGQREKLVPDDNKHGLVRLFDQASGQCELRRPEIQDKGDFEEDRLLPKLFEDDGKGDDGDGHAPRSRAVADLSTFCKHFEALFASELLRMINWDNVVVAGGAVSACMQEIPAKHSGSLQAKRDYFADMRYGSSDIDVFLYGLEDPEEANAKLIEVYEAIKLACPFLVVCFRSTHAVTMVSQYPYRHVQVVLRMYSSIYEVLAGFDIDSCTFAYRGGDRPQVFATPRGVHALLSGYNSVDLSRRSPSYEMRLAKYGSRGFAVHVPDLDRAKLDPGIFDRPWPALNGLAKLVMLEKLRTPAERRAYRARHMLASEATEEFRSRQRRGVRARDNRTLERLEKVGATAEASDYSTVFLPWGPDWTALRVLRAMRNKDFALNSPFIAKDRTFNLHPCFYGTAKEVIEDCCPNDPPIPSSADPEVLEKFVRGPLQWMQEDPGKQAIGSFHPLDAEGWYDDVFFDESAVALHRAMNDNDVSEVRALLAVASEERVNARDSLGRTPLHFGAIVGAVAAVQQLVEHEGCNLTAVTGDGRNVLHLCALYNQAAIAEVVLRAFADDTKEQKRFVEAIWREAYMTAAHVALAMEHHDVLGVLCRVGHADVKSARKLPDSEVWDSTLPLELVPVQDEKAATETLCVAIVDGGLKDSEQNFWIEERQSLLSNLVSKDAPLARLQLARCLVRALHVTAPDLLGALAGSIGETERLPIFDALMHGELETVKHLWSVQPTLSPTPKMQTVRNQLTTLHDTGSWIVLRPTTPLLELLRTMVDLQRPPKWSWSRPELTQQEITQKCENLLECFSWLVGNRDISKNTLFEVKITSDAWEYVLYPWLPEEPREPFIEFDDWAVAKRTRQRAHPRSSQSDLVEVLCDIKIALENIDRRYEEAFVKEIERYEIRAAGSGAQKQTPVHATEANSVELNPAAVKPALAQVSLGLPKASLMYNLCAVFLTDTVKARVVDREGQGPDNSPVRRYDFYPVQYKSAWRPRIKQLEGFIQVVSLLQHPGNKDVATARQRAQDMLRELVMVPLKQEDGEERNWSRRTKSSDGEQRTYSEAEFTEAQAYLQDWVDGALASDAHAMLEACWGANLDELWAFAGNVKGGLAQLFVATKPRQVHQGPLSITCLGRGSLQAKAGILQAVFEDALSLEDVHRASLLEAFWATQTCFVAELGFEEVEMNAMEVLVAYAEVLDRDNLADVVATVVAAIKALRTGDIPDFFMWDEVFSRSQLCLHLLHRRKFGRLLEMIRSFAHVLFPWLGIARAHALRAATLLPLPPMPLRSSWGIRHDKVALYSSTWTIAELVVANDWLDVLQDFVLAGFDDLAESFDWFLVNAHDDQARDILSKVAKEAQIRASLARKDPSSDPWRRLPSIKGHVEQASLGSVLAALSCRLQSSTLHERNPDGYSLLETGICFATDAAKECVEWLAHQGEIQREIQRGFLSLGLERAALRMGLDLPVPSHSSGKSLLQRTWESEGAHQARDMLRRLEETRGWSAASDALVHQDDNGDSILHKLCRDLRDSGDRYGRNENEDLFRKIFAHDSTKHALVSLRNSRSETPLECLWRSVFTIPSERCNGDSDSFWDQLMTSLSEVLPLEDIATEESVTGVAPLDLYLASCALRQALSFPKQSDLPPFRAKVSSANPNLQRTIASYSEVRAAVQARVDDFNAEVPMSPRRRHGDNEPNAPIMLPRKLHWKPFTVGQAGNVVFEINSR
ncbi:Uncharacterized protein R883 [Durusdinium trenchii]|uniref:Uncharacterized protein R883 n=1 Tax=Durusdinium trenchii TaxID=1381693 RepID=A0ABP0RSJ4_9DINO